MWLLVLFDLPVRTKPQRKEAAEFRKTLLRTGFQMMQFSVYMRSCASEENAQTHLRQIERALPPLGSVRIMQVTDKQFSRMHCFDGNCPIPTEKPPRQLEFF